MQNWEYKVIDWWPSERELNKLGLDGWELVSVATISAQIGSSDEVKAYLKRRLTQ